MTLVPPIARLLASTYYRLRRGGGTIPATGPVLLVANHPNSLLDPVLVLTAARRPVRFLAKAPLFTDPKLGWLMRLGRGIPVYRRQDDPGQMGQNEEMFRAVYRALGAGDAVGLFPEGISHSGASLAPLRTGAARIALGAAAGIGRAFPVVPIGLVFRAKDVFRSEALVLVGEPVAWDDLASAGADDPAAVRTLTDRLAASLRAQTVNLDGWHDLPVVETAVRIWEAEHGALPDPAERVRRLAVTTEVLARLRGAPGDGDLDLIAEVAQFGRLLERLGLRPGDLGADTSLTRGLRWTVGRLPLVLPFGALLAVVGWAAFLVPYHLTAVVVARVRLEDDTRSTWKAMVGSLAYLMWVLTVSALAWRWGGVGWGLVGLAIMPAVGMSGLLVRERWRGAWLDARRFLLLRSRRSLVQSLASRQQQLAQRLEALLQRYSDSEAR